MFRTLAKTLAGAAVAAFTIGALAAPASAAGKPVVHDMTNPKTVTTTVVHDLVVHDM